MSASRIALLLAVSVWSSNCQAVRSTSASTQAWQVLFGPLLTNELIVGHVVLGSSAWVMTSADALIRVNLATRTHVRTIVGPLAAAEHVWGLAAGEGNELWTLVGRSVLARVAGDGRVVERVNLTDPHVGVFGAGKQLVYQVMSFTPPADALVTGRPGGAERVPWSRMRTRELPLARTAVAALNLVSCGSTATGTVPCWFPDQAAVTLTDPSGASREIALEGLPVVAPEVLLASENPRRPVRDAFVSETGAVWVLGSGEPPARDEPARSGGWLLARYDPSGRIVSRTRLQEPARIILGVRNDRCLLLAWNGNVVEAQP